MRVKLISGIAILFGFVAITLIVSCQSNEELEFARYYSSGSLVYQKRCQNCHGRNGEGLQQLIPPLTDSLYLKANKNMLACAIKYGQKGKITIHNKAFEAQMPATDLPQIDIASVLTYITNSFGNKLGAINVQQVESDLGKCL
jgi:mono/diheme cytochrome c family protein